jgi:hypothetical protein
MIQTIGTYQIPVWALSALINGDYSGLSDAEEQALHDFEMSMYHEFKYHDEACTGLIFSPVGEPYFSHRNDIDGLGGDVHDVEVSGNLEEAA